MNIEEFREYCLAKKGATEEFPFDSNTLVFKIGNKIFALTDVGTFEGINLKCEPAKSIELRERYMGIRPGFHMNKVHWNTIETHGDVDDKLLIELIDHSYDLIVKSLPKKMCL